MSKYSMRFESSDERAVPVPRSSLPLTGVCLHATTGMPLGKFSERVLSPKITSSQEGMDHSPRTSPRGLLLIICYMRWSTQKGSFFFGSGIRNNILSG